MISQPLETRATLLAEAWGAAGAARQAWQRLVRLRGASVEGEYRERFVSASAIDLLDGYFEPRLAARYVLRWNRGHCRPPLTEARVLELFEAACAEGER